MGNSTNSPSQIIASPKGGGALRGIGEKFSPDLHTGTGNFTVPIALPAGRNGLQPELNLVYSSGNGNGPFGLGWSLSIPGIVRKTSGVPNYDNSKDVFILSGAEDLVPVADAADTTQYRPRTEGLFARITHHHGSNGNFWRVESKDGLESFYGSSSSGASGPSLITDSAAPDHIFAWKLTRTHDTFGNVIQYAYFKDGNQLYLSEIQYADYGPGSDPKFLVSVKFNYESRLDEFSDHRAGFEIITRLRCSAINIFTDPGTETLTRSYHLLYAGDPNLPESEIPHNHVSLLSQVRVVGIDGANLESLPPLEFRYTRFTPEERRFFPVTAAQLPPESLSHPDRELVSLFANGLPDLLEMNGVVRYWRNLGDGRFDRPRLIDSAPAGIQLADRGVQLLDANGDGRADLLVTTETISGYYPLEFGGVFNRHSFQKYLQAPSFDLKDPEVRMVDLDGDGVTDAIRSSTRLECFFNDPAEGWKESRWIERAPLDDFPNVVFSDPHVKFADMTGDGLQDVVFIHENRVDYWPSLGRGKWGKRIYMTNPPKFPWGYDPRRVLVGDVDGDGAADVVFVDHNQVTLWINRSGKSWSDPISFQGTPPIADLDSIRLLDLLGSGVSGLLWSRETTGLAERKWYFLDFAGGIKPYLLNEMDNHTGSITRIGYASSTKFYLQDEQRPATRWKTSLPFPVQVVEKVEAIDAVSQSKLTTEYSYHHGYWDGIEHEFRGFGRVDHRDSEVFSSFKETGLHPLGHTFEPVPEQLFSPPTETRTWFHLGAVGNVFGDWSQVDFQDEFWTGDAQVFSTVDPVLDVLKDLPRAARRNALRALRGRVLRTELCALDGAANQDRPFTVTEHLHGVSPLPVGQSWPQSPESWQEQVFFPYAVAERITQWERGSDPMTQFTFTANYDTYGQPTSQTSAAVPRGRDFRAGLPASSPSELYLIAQTVTDYAQREDSSHYIVDRVARVTGYEIPNDGRQTTSDDSLPLLELAEKIHKEQTPRKIISQTLHFYDGAAFAGLPFGTLGDYGAPVLSGQLVLDDNILQAAYGSAPPPYFSSGAAPAWSNEYPPEFQTSIPASAGYLYHPGGSGSPFSKGYFVAAEQRRYDFQDDPAGKGRGLVVAQRDLLQHETVISYDTPYNLLPIKVENAARLTTSATYDYRVLQPEEVVDSNGNRTAFTFTPLGLLASTAVMGKTGENVGDTTTVPGTTLTYDFFAFLNQQQPISARSLRRVHHANDSGISPSEINETLETVEYSDGFGRLIQTRSRAADVTFGDPVFGNDVLPAQASDPHAGDNIVGQKNSNPTQPNVVVSGWQVYDNKGRVVEKFEPFYSAGWDYIAPTAAQFGQKVTMFYDPRGQLIRTVNPDGSEQRVIYGVPGKIATPDLSNPAVFEPTPWESYTYDSNDNAGRTHASVSGSYQSHWNTPGGVIVDGLGRTVQSTQRNGSNPASEWYTTRFYYDIRGNLTNVTDPLGRVILQNTYDFVNRPLRAESLDAGIRRTVLNAAGIEIERRDSKGALILHSYDLLNRPVRMWARDDTNQALTLRENLIYGDDYNSGLTEAQAQSSNLLGKLYQHYDEAGLLTFEQYDFKGTMLERSRQVISDTAILSVFSPPPANWEIQPFRVAWQPASGTTLASLAATLLDNTVYTSSYAYDALNRIRTLRTPQNANGIRNELRPRYNRAGALEHVELDSDVYVEQIAYNAKGQRTLIAYGNGLMTRYAYDPATFRLLRLRTESYTKTRNTYQPSGAVLQDIGYSYDLAGNILCIVDRTPGCGVINNPESMQIADASLSQALVAGDALIRHFEYDPIYRLLSATGRECSDIPSPRPWPDDPTCGFNSPNHGTADQDNAPNLTTTYTEQYGYDPAGNLVKLKHIGNSATWLREFGVGGLAPQQWAQQWPSHLNGSWSNPPGNQLTHVGDNNPANPQTHFYDPNGSLVGENTSRHFEWDHSDHMRVYRTQTPGAEPSIYAQYLYDAGGQRIKKLSRKQGGKIEGTIYVDDIFEVEFWVNNGVLTQNNRLHVLDDQKRIAKVRVGTPHPEDKGPAIQYHLGDHLGSNSVVVDENGVWINREEYSPYGETLFGSFARKRYRFTGKECDQESGLYYYGARHYAPWLARWVRCDPAGTIDGLNLYRYARNNPIRYRDALGRASGDNITSYPQARQAANQGAAAYRQGKSMPTEVQAGHQFQAKDAPASGISEETLNSDFWQLYSRKGQGFDVTVEQPTGELMSRSRHTLMDYEISPTTRDLSIQGAGKFDPAVHGDAVAEACWRVESVNVDWRNIEAARQSPVVSYTDVNASGLTPSATAGPKNEFSAPPADEADWINKPGADAFFEEGAAKTPGTVSQQVIGEEAGETPLTNVAGEFGGATAAPGAPSTPAPGPSAWSALSEISNIGSKILFVAGNVAYYSQAFTWSWEIETRGYTTVAGINVLFKPEKLPRGTVVQDWHGTQAMWTGNGWMY